MKRIALMLASLSVMGLAHGQINATVYENTNLSGTRFRSSSGMFDDVLIPVDRLPGSPATLEVTRVTFQYDLLDAAGPLGTERFTFYYAAAMPGVIDSVSQPVPTGAPVLFGEHADWIAGGGQTTISFGNGSDTLFTVPLSYDALPGYATFFVGAYSVGARSGSGWLPSNGPDFNLRRPDYPAPMFQYSTSTSSWNAYTISGNRDTFNMVVEAQVVPEPGTMLALAAGAGALALRRRRRQTR